jgi:methanogenic corrinoid protein MtbC1
MPDMTDQSLSAGTATESAAARRSSAWRNRSQAAIWRLRPALQPVSVVRKIKAQILPRIVLALRSLPPATTPEATTPSPAPAVDAFAVLALGSNELAAFDYVEALLAQGLSAESVFLDLLAPTARHLGAMWESDATDFANVTLGVSRLQRIMWQLGETFVSETGAHDVAGESILLTIIPGEQHSFGLSMVAEFFRRAGWNLCTGPFASNQELTSLIHHQWFDLVGFSISSDRRLDELKKEIVHIRRDSRNPKIGVILGGPMMIGHPELVASMGADMMSVDATSAPQDAHSLIERMKYRE